MICQNCGNSFEEGKICPVCKNDALLLNKARTASLKLYNKGVIFAKDGDYSRAIDALNRCILFDKRNYVARNLLGIVYFEVGMPFDALKQWIISSSMKTEKNPASKYIDSLQKNARMLEKYNDAIKMYNRALKQFDSNCEDLAVIQLKKAVDFNPKFVEAYNLLALYSISIGDKQRAKLYIDKALSIDKRNPKALRNLFELNSDGEETNKGAFKTGYNENAYRISKVKKFIKTELVAFFIGMIFAASISWALVAPAIKSGLTSQIDVLEDEVKRLKEENINGTSTFALKYKILEEENDLIKAENNKFKEEEKNREQINNLQLSNIYVAGGKLKEAAELLITIIPENFSSEDAGLIENLKKQAYPEAAKDYYEKGKEFFAKGENEDAQTSLLKSLEFGNKEDFIDNVLYILGQIYEEKGDIAHAKEYYGRVLNEFSDSDVYSLSEQRLNALLTLN